MRSPAPIIAAALFLITGAVNLQVPLYRTYARAAGWGTGLTAVTFATYVAGLLPVLIFCGGLSDRLGRKPVVLAGLLAALLATALVIARPAMPALLVARLLQGIGVGLGVGAGTAWLAEVWGGARGATRAAGVVAITTSLGFGGGALFTSATLLRGQALVPASYWALLLLTVGCLALLTALPGSAAAGGALLRLPHFPPGTLPLGAAIATAWAVTGLVIAIVPAQLARDGLAGWAGPALFLVNGTGALCQPLVRRLAARRALGIGFALLPLGYLILLGGVWRGLLPLVLAGAAIAGAACYGFTYLGGLAEVARLGGAARARAVSGYFLCAYLGFGGPSVLLGFLAERTGVARALLGFGVIVVATSAALAWQLRRARPAVTPAPSAP